MSDWCLSEWVLARWWHPVASSEALDLLYRAMCAVSYCRIAMAIKTASKVGVLFDCHFVDCRPGSRWGNTEWVVARWRLPGVSSVGMVQANAEKLLNRNKIKSFNQCPKLSSRQCPNEYKCITTTTPPYVILITNPPPHKLYTHLSWALLFHLICNTPIENRGLSVDLRPFCTSWGWKNSKKMA
jgi:hypothetical protein